MADEQLLDKIHNLSDLELAALLGLIAREHCLVSTEPDSVDELAEELRLIASKTFNLTSAIISCHPHTTLDEFATGLCVPPNRAPPSPGNTRSVSPYRPRHEQSQLSVGGPGPSSGSYFPLSPSPRIGGPVSPISPGSSSQVSQPRIANVVLAKDLDRAPRAIQIQVLELLRTRRIFTRTSVQTAPKQFLFIAIIGASGPGQARVTPHLNDFFYLSHWHDPEEDGFPYLDEEYSPPPRPPNDNDQDDAASTRSNTSVVKLNRHASLALTTTGLGIPSIDHQDHWRPRKNSTASSARSGVPSQPQQHQQQHHPQPQKPQKPTPNPPQPPPPPHTLTEHEIAHLSLLSRAAHTSVPITRYQSNLVSFLRTHRAVAPGCVTPAATQHLARLSASLAPLHGLDYVTPALVGLAARKVYGHRLRVVGADGGGWERERSLQWGGERDAVRGLLEGVGVEEVLEEVLGAVRVPV